LTTGSVHQTFHEVKQTEITSVHSRGGFFSSPAPHPLLMEATAAPASPQSLTSAVLRR